MKTTEGQKAFIERFLKKASPKEVRQLYLYLENMLGYNDVMGCLV